MKTLYQTLVVVIIFSFSGLSATSAGEQKSTVSGSRELELMKQLVGTWEGTASMAEEGEKVTVKYELTSADSVLVETLFPGTPHEMVSVYHDSGGSLNMTHYCALKNQPRMRVSEAESNSIHFDFVGGTNLDSQSDPHIHNLKLSLLNDNQIVQEWTLYERGQKKAVNTIKLSRVR